MRPGERVEVRVTYFDKLDLDRKDDGIAYRMKMGVRRHLSEFRDNYISQNDLVGYRRLPESKRLLQLITGNLKRFTEMERI